MKSLCEFQTGGLCFFSVASFVLCLILHIKIPVINEATIEREVPLLPVAVVYVCVS